MAAEGFIGKEEPMNHMPALRSVLVLAIILLVTLWAVPAHSWHGSGNITALAIAPRTMVASQSA